MQQSRQFAAVFLFSCAIYSLTMECTGEYMCSLGSSVQYEHVPCTGCVYAHHSPSITTFSPVYQTCCVYCCAMAHIQLGSWDSCVPYALYTYIIGVTS